MYRKVGLLGGTFDPVHLGHVKIAKSFIESSCIDELWILLTPYPPHKQEGNYVDYDIRREMLEAAFSGIEGISISTIENTLPKPSFTINTINELKKLYPNFTFFFCLGEDSLSQFHSWKYNDKIIEEVQLLAAQRPGASHSHVNDDIIRRTIFTDHEPYNISSTEIRDMVNEGADISDYVPEQVEQIIKKYELYN